MPLCSVTAIVVLRRPDVATSRTTRPRGEPMSQIRPHAAVQPRGREAHAQCYFAPHYREMRRVRMFGTQPAHSRRPDPAMKDRECRCALPSARSRVSPGSKEARRRQRFKRVGFGHRVSRSRGDALFQDERDASGSRRMTARRRVVRPIRRSMPPPIACFASPPLNGCKLTLLLPRPHIPDVPIPQSRVRIPRVPESNHIYIKLGVTFHVSTSLTRQ